MYRHGCLVSVTRQKFFADDRNRLRCFDADTHLVAFHAEYRDMDVITDHEGFTSTAGQYEHGGFLSVVDGVSFASVQVHAS